MTFYEAALRVLENSGRPLHFQEITEKSIAENLLSHVGKTPEQTMLSRLAAMARRTKDRKVVVTAKDTFALADWALPEDTEALAQTGVPEPNPEADLPPLRPAERHPEPRADNIRASGRSERKWRRDEEDDGRRKKRFPAMPDVIFEILSEGESALIPAELLSRAQSKELARGDLTVEQMLASLLEDNQKRIDAGRRPQFVYSKEAGTLGLEAGGAELQTSDIQAALAQAANIPFENGRPVFPVVAAAAAPPSAAELVDSSLFLNAKSAVKEARRAAARALRKRLADVEGGTFERACVKMMHGLGFRELKVAKRSKEGPLFTGRKREGSVELRYAVRLLKGNAHVDRRCVQELRKDLGHYAAQVGLVLAPGEVRGDARSEAQSSGALVLLWCSDALGEKFLEAEAGVNVTQIQLFEIDERFFEQAKVDADETLRRREERTKERKGGREQEAFESGSFAAETPAPRSGGPSPGSSVAKAAPASESADDSDDADGDDESSAEAGTAQGAAAGVEGGAGSAEKRGRRRRRRGRRGRGGPKPEGVPGSPAANAEAPAPGGGSEAPGPAVAAAAEPAAAPSAPAPAPPPSSEGGTA